MIYREGDYVYFWHWTNVKRPIAGIVAAPMVGDYLWIYVCRNNVLYKSLAYESDIVKKLEAHEIVAAKLAGLIVDDGATARH